MVPTVTREFFFFFLRLPQLSFHKTLKTVKKIKSLPLRPGEMDNSMRKILFGEAVEVPEEESKNKNNSNHGCKSLLRPQPVCVVVSPLDLSMSLCSSCLQIDSASPLLLSLQIGAASTAPSGHQQLVRATPISAASATPDGSPAQSSLAPPPGEPLATDVQLQISNFVYPSV